MGDIKPYFTFRSHKKRYTGLKTVSIVFRSRAQGLPDILNNWSRVARGFRFEITLDLPQGLRCTVALYDLGQDNDQE
ncbi:hypothetical protein ES703_117258 [subsurface metagenome]